MPNKPNDAQRTTLNEYFAQGWESARDENCKIFRDYPEVELRRRVTKPSGEWDYTEFVYIGADGKKSA